MTRLEDNPITVAIRERYGICQAVPYGAMTALAGEFGVTRERVRQIVRAIQYGNIPREQRERTCACGRTFYLNPATRYDLCPSCQRALKHVRLPCSTCGKPVLRSAKLLARQVSHGRYTGAVFCDRQCFHRGPTAGGKGKPRPRQQKVKS